MEDWQHLLYVRNASIYQSVLEAGLSTAPAEARGLSRIFRHYGLKANAVGSPKVLDVCCGIGRHSISLAKLGYEVVGFDFSPYFLKTARSLAEREGLTNETIRFYEGNTTQILDTLDANGETGFDAIICMDTSIVRQTLREEIDLLHSLCRVGKAKSLLVIETASREYFLKRKDLFFTPFLQSFPRSIKRQLQSTYNSKTNQIRGTWKFYREPPNEDLKYLFTIRLVAIMHSQRDLRSTLKRGGWDCLDTYGDVKRLNSFDSDSYHIVMVAKKAIQTQSSP